MAAVGACAVDRTSGKYTIVTWVLTSHTDSTVSGVEIATEVSGQIERLLIVPEAGNLPSDGYDLFIADVEGSDVTLALGTNLTGATTYDVVPMLTDGNVGNAVPIPVQGDLTITGADMGSETGVTVTLYIR